MKIKVKYSPPNIDVVRVHTDDNITNSSAIIFIGDNTNNHQPLLEDWIENTPIPDKKFDL